MPLIIHQKSATIAGVIQLGGKYAMKNAQSVLLTQLAGRSRIKEKIDKLKSR